MSDTTRKLLEGASTDGSLAGQAKRPQTSASRQRGRQFSPDLFRCAAHGMNDLVVRLRVIQLGLEKQRLRVEFLRGCQVSLGVEGRSLYQLLLQHPVGFGAQSQQLFRNF